MEAWLATPLDKHPPIYRERFCTQNSSKKDIAKAKKLLFEDIKVQRIKEIANSWKNNSVLPIATHPKNKK